IWWGTVLLLHCDSCWFHSSQLQCLKCSLSFKSMMRSKSVENFFQRSSREARFLSDIIPSGQSPFPSLPPNTSISSYSPSLSPSPSLPSKSAAQMHPVKLHCFQEHMFRRSTHFQLCKHIIIGNSKQGLRGKSCKLGAHLWCLSELSQQPCAGKSGAFKRNFSSPLLINDQLGIPSLDPVYEALRYGTSLAQMSRSSFGSITESPNRSERSSMETGGKGSVCPTALGWEQGQLHITRIIEVHSIHTYVALYKFLPQEKNDLELHPGDRVQVTDDSDEDWWKGKSKDMVGFFPANFVQRVRPGERVWMVTQAFHGNREKGQMTIKYSQICVGKSEESNGFLRLSSGKKKGLVPRSSLEEI
uniref:SH3 and cysteine-rich domain-containing protein 2 n=1 Tax=Paramormyrops kingsleyae TaxID=1676925 RepID=A0A3B3QHX5_9TELE